MKTHCIITFVTLFLSFAGYSQQIWDGDHTITGNFQLGQEPASEGNYGQKFHFGHPGENYDEIFIARYNVELDKSELRVNVGDDSNDKFVVGRIFWEGTEFTPMFTVMTNGNVGIGQNNPDYKLEVAGTIRAQEVKIENTNWPDYVFSKDYRLPSIAEVSKHIEENSHLPGIPSAKEVEENGVNLSEMNAKLLQKIEELTLYMIQQDKRIESLEQQLNHQQ